METLGIEEFATIVGGNGLEQATETSGSELGLNGSEGTQDRYLCFVWDLAANHKPGLPLNECEQSGTGSADWTYYQVQFPVAELFTALNMLRALFDTLARLWDACACGAERAGAGCVSAASPRAFHC